MKYLTLLILPILFAGCWSHHSDHCYYDSYGDYWCDSDSSYITHTPPQPTNTTTVIYTEENSGGPNNNIIVVEEQYGYCDWDTPYYHDADYCSYGSEVCCTWSASLYGLYETYCYSDYCGWELVLVEEDYSY